MSNNKDKDLHKNHRQRMDMKAEMGGLENMPEHEVLERLLFMVIPRGNTNETAKRLCDEFGGIGGVLRADISELEKIEGIGHRAAVFLHDLPEVLGIVERSLKFKAGKIKNTEDACEFAKTLFYGKLNEQFYMISLTSTGVVIKFNKVNEGSDDEVKAQRKNIAKLAIRNGASKVVIAHNHPGGTAVPSLSDRSATEGVRGALAAVGIELLDSIIVACGVAKSIMYDF